jgi:hypothetical protein
LWRTKISRSEGGCLHPESILSWAKFTAPTDGCTGFISTMKDEKEAIKTELLKVE